MRRHSLEWVFVIEINDLWFLGIVIEGNSHYPSDVDEMKLINAFRFVKDLTVGEIFS